MLLDMSWNVFWRSADSRSWNLGRRKAEWKISPQLNIRGISCTAKAQQFFDMWTKKEAEFFEEI